MKKKTLKKEGLMARLKALVGNKTPKGRRDVTARYYSPFEKKHFKCADCGKKTHYLDIEGDFWPITTSILTMRLSGHDVDVKTVCKECAKKYLKQGERNPGVVLSSINFIFYFRTSPDEEYHAAIANIASLYKSLEYYLDNGSVYIGDNDEKPFIDAEIAALEYMTGLHIERNGD